MPVDLSNAARGRAYLKLPLHCKPQTALVKTACRSLSVCSCVSPKKRAALGCLSRPLQSVLSLIGAVNAIVYPHSGCLQVELPAQGCCAIKPWPWRRRQQAQVSWSGKGLQAPAVSACGAYAASTGPARHSATALNSQSCIYQRAANQAFEASKRQSLPGDAPLPLQCAVFQLRQRRTAGSARETHQQWVPLAQDSIGALLEQQCAPGCQPPSAAAQGTLWTCP